jgi:hypothetical protein
MLRRQPELLRLASAFSFKIWSSAALTTLQFDEL